MHLKEIIADEKYVENIARDTISIEIDGKTYIGTVIRRGTNRIFQTISYEIVSKADHHEYHPSEFLSMDRWARHILGEIIYAMLKDKAYNSNP